VVAPDRLRFDFSWSEALTPEQVGEVERLVNGRILHGGAVTTEYMPLAEAKKVPGVRAVFGEKYPDPVRVVKMGGVLDTDMHEHVSAEFCGGTHLDRIDRIGLFKILSEESVARGVRRITAVTGLGAVEWALTADAALRETSGLLSVSAEQIPQRVVAMQKEIKKLKKRPASGRGGLADTRELQTPSGIVLVARADVADPGAMRSMCDQQRQKGAAAVFVGAVDETEGKVMLVAMVSDELVDAKALGAGDWIKQVAPIVGGGGGGKPRLAQAGGKLPDKLPDALAAAADYAADRLGGQ
jgi:alanyl-tRNA synthetase